MSVFQKLMSRHLLRIISRTAIQGRGMCMKDLDKPVKYSSSGAASWKAQFSRSGETYRDESAWFQPYAVTASIAVFLIYFCILREESDIDDGIYIPLYHKIDGLEEQQLQKTLQYRLDNGLPTADITARLNQIKAEKES